MTATKATRATKMKALEYVDKWGWIANKFGWVFTMHWFHSTKGMPRSANERTHAVCFPNFPYLNANIHVNLESCTDLDDQELEEVIVHELVHLLLSPIHDDLPITPLEMVTVWITRILLAMGEKYDEVKQ